MTVSPAKNASPVGTCGRCQSFVEAASSAEVNERLYCKGCVVSRDLDDLARPSWKQRSRRKTYREFPAARIFAHELRLDGVQDWLRFVAGELREKGALPEDIPSNPQRCAAYRDEWKGWGDFLGTGRLASGDQVWRSLEEALPFVRSLALGNVREWIAWCQGLLPGKPPRPADIPKSPDFVYREQWRGWSWFLGTRPRRAGPRRYRAFAEARAFARSLGLTDLLAWRAYCGGKRPELPTRPADVPRYPAREYGDEWTDWPDWLGVASPEAAATGHVEESLGQRACERRS